MLFSKLYFASCFLVLLMCCSNAMTQGIIKQKKANFSPAEESFQSVSMVTIPWRMTGCHPVYPEPDCKEITQKEFLAADKLTLHERDGSLWYRFSLDRKNPEYFLTKTKPEFEPFATYPRSPVAVFLPIVAESDNWYEVEVNKKTHLTKYISKSDKLWAAVPWEFWLKRSPQIKVDFQKHPLLKEPEGNELVADIGGAPIPGEYEATYLKADGEWAYVLFSGERKYYGWIRWRKGTEIFISCAYNHFTLSKNN